MRRKQKLPACDPCRASKLACDHVRPVCSRCHDKEMDNACVYRLAPFKKNKKFGSSTKETRSAPATRSNYSSRDTETLSPPDSNVPISVPGLLSKPHRYPNPGYLGSSSHTTFFGQLPLPITNTGSVFDGQSERGTLPDTVVNEAQVAHGAELIEQLHRFVHVPVCASLVKRWLATGANLPLAGDLVETCSSSAETILAAEDGQPRDSHQTSKGLFSHSYRPLQASSDTTSDEFCAQFSNENSRWETLGLFLVAVARAALVRRDLEPPWDMDQYRRSVAKLAMHYADRCLEMALSLDCLNDLQLVLQFENFVLHSHVDGDHSFESWRRLGDVISSLFALGYHQDIERGGPIPSFLRDLRQAAFACALVTDKNVSIFLGRPSRISTKLCRFSRAGASSYFAPDWDQETALSLRADVRWAALCALIKERILELSDNSSDETSTDQLRYAVHDVKSRPTADFMKLH